MGPAQISAKPFTQPDPPMFNPAEDFQKSRREVLHFVKTIQAVSKKGSGRLQKTVYAKLGRHFYHQDITKSGKLSLSKLREKSLSITGRQPRLKP